MPTAAADSIVTVVALAGDAAAAAVGVDSQLNLQYDISLLLYQIKSVAPVQGNWSRERGTWTLMVMGYSKLAGTYSSTAQAEDALCWLCQWWIIPVLDRRLFCAEHLHSTV